MKEASEKGRNGSKKKRKKHG